MNSKMNLSRTSSTATSSQRMIDQDIVKLSGGIFNALPFVEKPLAVFLPQSPKTRCKATLRSRSYRHERQVDADLIHLTGALFYGVSSVNAEEQEPESLKSGVPSVSTFSVDVEGDVDSILPQEFDVVAVSHRGFAAKTARIVTALALGAASIFAGLVLHHSQPATQSGMVSPAAAMAAPRAESASVKVDAVQPKREATIAAPAKATVKVPSAAAVKPSVRAAASVEQAPLAASAAPEQAAPVAIDMNRAASAIAAASRNASACIEPGEGSRSMTVSVRFASSGQATRALIEDGSLLGTAAASCVTQHLRSAKINSFDGDAVTVRTRITVR